MKMEQESSLIDLGCRSTSFLFASMMPKNTTITEIDFSTQMIEKAQHDLKKDLKT